MFKIIPPYLGVAYYPEDWDISEIDIDIEKMREIGINVARIGEFAWRKMEPEEGKFDFLWLHSVVDKLKSAGIGVVMGTPTAVPPIWLTKNTQICYLNSKAEELHNTAGGVMLVLIILNT